MSLLSVYSCNSSVDGRSVFLSGMVLDLGCPGTGPWRSKVLSLCLQRQHIRYVRHYKTTPLGSYDYVYSWDLTAKVSDVVSFPWDLTWYDLYMSWKGHWRNGPWSMKTSRLMSPWILPSSHPIVTLWKYY